MVGRERDTERAALYIGDFHKLRDLHGLIITGSHICFVFSYFREGIVATLVYQSSTASVKVVVMIPASCPG